MNRRERRLQESRNRVGRRPADARVLAGASRKGAARAAELVAVAEKADAATAVAAYRQLAGLPDVDAAAYSAVGKALARLGCRDEAVAACRTAVRLEPNRAETHLVLGLVLAGFDEIEAAHAPLSRAAQLLPGTSTHLATIATLFASSRHLADAEDLCHRMLAVSPEDSRPLSTLARIRSLAGSYVEAIDLARRALDRDPENRKALYDLAVSLGKEDRHGESLPIWRKLSALVPGDASVRSALGVALIELGDFEAAETELRKAADLKPECPDIDGNLATALQQNGRLAEAEAVYEAALRLHPEHAMHRLSLALLKLGQGRYEEGWQEYEWRWKCGDATSTVRPLPQPRWDGSPLQGKRILVSGEQGLGDEIMFAGLLEDLRAMGARVAVECNVRLATLFRRSFPAVDVVPSMTPPAPAALEESIDFHIPAGSTLQYLRPDASRFSPRPRYLETDEQMVAALRARYASLGDGLKVGIAWRSGNKANGRFRSIPLKRWAPLLTLPGLRFVNLQYGDCRAEIEEVHDLYGVRIHQDESIDAFGDLDPVAAQVDALDLVVTADNSTVHLAGALGKPAWLLVPSWADWRWGRNDSENDWYRSVRLFRQSRPGDWDSVFEEVVQTARTLSSGSPPSLPSPAGATTAPATPSAAVQGRVVLLNDTSDWYHWGCTGTSTALRQVMTALGHPVTSIPIRDTYNLCEGPKTLADFDRAESFERFRRANPLVIARVEDADIVVVNGEGTLHGTSEPVRNLLYLAYAAKRHMGRNVHIVNHSCYPEDDSSISDVMAQALYKKVYSAMDYVAIREHLSLGLVSRLGIPAALAFDCLPIYIAENYTPPGGTGRRSLVVSGSATIDRLNLQGLVAYLRSMLRRGFEITVLTGARAFPAADDHRFLAALEAAMPEGWTHNDAASMDEWLDCISDASLLVSGRFHHSVAAAALDTPFVTMSSNTPKIQGMLEMIDHAPAIPLDSEDLLDRLCRAGDAELARGRNPEAHAERLQALVQMGLRNFDGLARLHRHDRPVAAV